MQIVLLSGTVTDAEIQEVMAMSDEDVWKGLTGGYLTDRPSDKSPSNADQIEANVRSQIVNITVPIRAWAEPNDDSNMKKVKREMTLEVNGLLAKLWTAFFEDLYNDAPDFVISSLGCFRIDGLGTGQIGFLSAHTYGAAVDINWNINPYGSQQPYSEEQWKAMGEGHLKYETIYTGSDVVKIAHKYTLYWGGEWLGDTKDLMHFSFVCDGKTRAERLQLIGN